MSNKTINVDGMTCDHCVKAVTEELSKISGVTAVNIDLHAGEISPVEILSANEISDADISAAVEEAGYSIVSS
jgi:copper ion binding protein